MKILIAGSSGFIGSRLVSVMDQQGHRVFSWPERIRNFGSTEVSGPMSTSANLSTEVANLLNETGCDAFVNLAWGGLPDYSPSTTARNAELSVAIQQGWAQSSCPLYVGFGSCLEYGRSQGPLNEISRSLDADFFGKTKTWLLDHSRELAGQFEKRYLWIRPFWLFGPGQREASLVPAALRSAREGRLLPLRTPDVFLDFLHVDDLCEALVGLIEQPYSKGVFNIGSGEPIRVGDIAQMVFSISTGDRLHHISPTPEGKDATWSTNRRLNKMFSWSPSRSIEQYVRDVILEQEPV